MRYLTLQSPSLQASPPRNTRGEIPGGLRGIHASARDMNLTGLFSSSMDNQWILNGPLREDAMCFPILRVDKSARVGYPKNHKETPLRSVQTMSGDTRAIISTEPSRATHLSFACPAMNAGSATPTKNSSTAETSVTMLVSFFVLVLLAVLFLLVLVHLVLVRCLTGLVKLNSLVGLTTPRACTAGQGV